MSQYPYPDRRRAGDRAAISTYTGRQAASTPIPVSGDATPAATYEPQLIAHDWLFCVGCAEMTPFGHGGACVMCGGQRYQLPPQGWAPAAAEVDTDEAMPDPRAASHARREWRRRLSLLAVVQDSATVTGAISLIVAVARAWQDAEPAGAEVVFFTAAAIGFVAWYAGNVIRMFIAAAHRRTKNSDDEE